MAAMPEITEVTCADVLRELPSPVPFTTEKMEAAGAMLLICCAGFEDRASAVVKDVTDGSKADLILITYPTNPKDNAAALSAFELLGVRRQVPVAYERTSFLRTIRTALRPYSKAGDIKVIVDVSGMASYVFYRVMEALWLQLPQAYLCVYYAEACEYRPHLSEWKVFYDGVADQHDSLAIAEKYEESHFQSSGIDETYESEVFPGKNLGALATELIAIPSFSLHRTKSMLAFADAQYNAVRSRTIWILGQPPDRPRNGWRHDALAALYNVPHNCISVSTRDFGEMMHRLDAIWESRVSDAHLVVASLGSKLQHLGIFLFLKMHPECGLLHCEPREFLADRYSSGIGPKWWIEFGSLECLKGLLSSRGDVLFDWGRQSAISQG
jgi:hypothetical protein